MLARLGSFLDRAAFKPASLPDDLVTGLALLPAVVAGLVIFKVPAAQMLAAALAAGSVGVLFGYWFLRRQTRATPFSPLISAVFAVALVGAGAGAAVAAEVAVVAVVLELMRVRYMPAIRAQAGLLAYAGFALVTRGLPFSYVNPANGAVFTEPIATWLRFFGPSSAPVDPIRLYVGNVPGPVFATSLLAVAVGIAWLAYARRVSLVVLIAFLAGAGLAIYTFRWDPLFQLDSGPTWFVAGLLLADRRLLPDSWAIRPILGFTGGLFGIGLRHNGFGIEAAFYVVAVVQAVMALVVIVWFASSVMLERWRRTRRLRQREANLRAVKTISRAS